MDQIENTSSLDYEYKINPTEDPEQGNIDSNTTSTNLVLGELSMVKSVDKTYATIGDILTYTVVVSNVGNILATDIMFEDIIPAGATFVSGSVYVDSVNQPTFNPNTGFSLDSILILGSKTVTFQVEVTSLESPNIISNQATTEFKYLVILPVTGTSSSNIVTTTVNVSDLSVVKSASAEYVTAGDTLTYTIIITNNGNIDATDLFFTDLVPSELTFVTGSVTVNDISQPTYDPNVGFNLGTIIPTGTIKVEFDTLVN